MSGATSPIEVRLQEWQTVMLDGLSLTEADRELARSLAQEGRRLLVEELRAGVRVSSRSWVGMIRFEAFDLIIEPKLAGENLGLVRLLEFTTGLLGFRRISSRRTLSVEPNTLDLFDLLALLFTEECAAVVRGGLLSDYVSREDVLPALRGRLMADRQLTRQFGRIDQLECRFDEHETNTPENQILAAALAACSRRSRDREVRGRVRRLENIFAEVCDPSTADLRLIRETMVYNRMNEQYREAHALAWFILDVLGIRDVLAAGSTRSFAFLIDMNALFERFVWRVLEIVCARHGLRVQYQRKDRSILWDEKNSKTYASVIPDLLVNVPDTNHFLAVDAKYKQYDERKLSSTDIYQTFLYAFAYGTGRSDDAPRALLIYPASQVQVQQAGVQVRNRKGRGIGSVRALGIHIPTLLHEVRSGVPGPQSKALTSQTGRLANYNPY